VEAWDFGNTRGNSEMDFDLDKYRNYIKPTLKRAIEDKNWAKLNEHPVFYARETAGLISIAEFGNEEAKKFAMRRLENWYFTGKGAGGWSKIKAASSWIEAMDEYRRKQEKQEKSEPIQEELF
jgi:hypothetical protein